MNYKTTDSESGEAPPVDNDVDSILRRAAPPSAARFFSLIKDRLEREVSGDDVLLILSRVAGDLVDVDAEDMQMLAGRLLVLYIRKCVWNGAHASLYERIRERVERGLYDGRVLEEYERKEIDYLERDIVKDERDFDLSLAGARMFYDKYLLRSSGVVVETPQEANILVCLFLFMGEKDKARRLSLVGEAYNYLSTFVISLPTPVYSGLRSTLKSFASCCVLDCADTVDSILAASYMAAKAVTRRYGIGVNCGRVRGMGASVANGTSTHAGVVPVLKMLEASVKGFSQGVRGGSATVAFPFWHWEIATVLNLKNNRGVVENRVRGLDYSIGINRLFLERALGNGKITLFSPEEVPSLCENYKYSDVDFRRVYEGYEKEEGRRKKEVDALQLLKDIARERYETGRVYVYFMDNANQYSAFEESIFSPNLCQEVFLPTRPSTIYPTEGGLAGVCLLACLNVGRLEDTEGFSQMPAIANILVRALNNLIDYQEYPFPQMARMAADYRPLGIGVSDLFHLLAMRHLSYDTQECRDYVHRLMEAWQYSLLSASCSLAEEEGPCAAFGLSRYSTSVLPAYKATVDRLVSVGLRQDWRALGERVAKHGLRNTCLSAVPPTASSSAVSNSTPGVDPPRDSVITKLSKAGAVRTVIPDFARLAPYYTLSQEVSTLPYLKLVAVIQKFVDQGVSTNTYYMATTPSVGDIVEEVATAFSYGLKSLYYLNTNKGVDSPSCDGGACVV